MTNGLVLKGCTPTPLASYLKALAVLRLVAEAGVEGGGDPDARGFWREDVFVLRTRLTEEQLREFFLDRYQPTPLIAPWGARSGFFAGSSEMTAREALATISQSDIGRLEPFRNTIRTVRHLLSRHGFDEKASDERKLDLLNLCRAVLPDAILPWLDACYILTTDGRKFPPLLGTGGNEGSGSYVSGFAQQVVACLVRREHDGAIGAALFGGAAPYTHSAQTPGHFSPHGSGGANSSVGFEGDGQLNAWDYLLCLEGTLLFAGAATRRHEGDPPQINFPFVVAPTAAGHGSYVFAEERPKKAKRQVMEMWLPLWERPMAIEELRVLFSEGRATLGAKAAENGLDFARALAGLGIDRGLSSFQRFAFLMRNGQSFFASPLDRYSVRRSPGADIIGELDHRGWLHSVEQYSRDDQAPHAFRASAHQLDGALFALTQQGGPLATQGVLRKLGAIEQALSRSDKAREAVPVPAPGLSLSWANNADDDSAEFRIAAALAGLCSRDEHGHRVLHARRHFAAVGESLNREGDRSWEPDSRLAVWSQGPLSRNLAALLHRRRLAAIALGADGEVLASQTGATRDDVSAFLEGATDDSRIGELLGGLACVDWSGAEPSVSDRRVSVDGNLSTLFELLKVFFTPESVLRALKWLPPDRTLRLPGEIPARLAADDVSTAVRIAWHRLRGLGVKMPGRNAPRVVGELGMGPRWLAALCIPLAFAETARLLRSFNLSPDPDAAAPLFTEANT